MSNLSTIEILENRIAPASILNPHTIAFTDADGDDVKVVFSKDVFIGSVSAQAAIANQVFKFDTGSVSADATTPQQLQLIDFTKFPVVANKGSLVNGVSMTLFATQKGSGNGFVDVGAIKAVGVSLGRMTIPGDLGQIDAGGSGLKIGCAGLSVKSLGQRGITTQIPVPTPTADNPAPDLVSTITGELTYLKVADDIKEARVKVADGRNSQQQITTAAKIGSIHVGGSIFGRTAVEAASDNTGLIECDRTIGPVVIGTDANDGIIGGGGANSGRITANGRIASLHIFGDLQGGAGTGSGSVFSGNSVGAVSLGGDVHGGGGEMSGRLLVYGNIASLSVNDVIAGTGPASGIVQAFGAISTTTVSGDINGAVANVGNGAGGIFANGLTKVRVNGSITGGSSGQTGYLESGRGVGTVSVLGSVTGGAGNASGSILVHADAHNILINGSLIGATGKQSGSVRVGLDVIQTGTLAAVTVHGHIDGGDGENSGSINAGGNIGVVTVGIPSATLLDVLKGGAGDYSGTITGHGRVGVLNLLGNVTGGSGKHSGGLFSYDRTDANGSFAGSFGSINITGELTGGTNEDSGAIHANGEITALVVHGVTGGNGAGSGSIHTGEGVVKPGNAGSIRILGDLKQAEVNPGANSANVIVGGRLNSMLVTGKIEDATLRAGRDLGVLTVGGDVSGSVVSARGQAIKGRTVDLAMGKLNFLGSVSNSSVLAGYNLAGNGANPDAQIGVVNVRHDWTASDLVAGAVEGIDPGFGNQSDIKAPGTDVQTIVSKIASITIGGTVAGSGVPGESFGFVAQLIAKMRVGTTVFALDNLPNGQTFPVGAADSGVTVREISL